MMDEEKVMEVGSFVGGVSDAVSGLNAEQIEELKLRLMELKEKKEDLAAENALDEADEMRDSRKERLVAMAKELGALADEETLEEIQDCLYQGKAKVYHEAKVKERDMEKWKCFAVGPERKIVIDGHVFRVLGCDLIVFSNEDPKNRNDLLQKVEKNRYDFTYEKCWNGEIHTSLFYGREQYLVYPCLKLYVDSEMSFDSQNVPNLNEKMVELNEREYILKRYGGYYTKKWMLIPMQPVGTAERNEIASFPAKNRNGRVGYMLTGWYDSLYEGKNDILKGKIID